MTQEESLYATLSAYAPLVALVGTRISPMQRTQKGSLPAVTWMLASGGYEYTHDGPQDMQHDQMQVDVWASTSEACAAVAETVKAALHGGDSPLSGQYFWISNISASMELDGDAVIFRRLFIVECWFRMFPASS